MDHEIHIARPFYYILQFASMMYQTLIKFFTIITINVVSKTNAYCWQPGKNPSFTGKPTVAQIDLSTVMVKWNNLVSKVECVDQFLVKYWRDNPNEYEETSFLPKHVFFISVKVIPRVEYTFEVIAREDKGILGVDYNRAEKIKFKTSKYNTDVKPYMVTVLPKSLEVR